MSRIDIVGLLKAVDTAVEMVKNEKKEGAIPVPDYTDINLSDKVVQIIQPYVGLVNKMEKKYMRRMSLDELKTTQLEILNYVAQFCEENNIHYWIDCGTLLGAIRHKGYIPWDDDIDIGMLREDYDRFISIFPQMNSNGRYQLSCLENDRSFHVAFAKIIDTSTVLYEPDENGFKTCVNIDVFVYDNAPDDDNLVAKQFKRRNYYQKLYLIKTSHHLPEKNWIKRLLKRILHYCLVIVPNDVFLRKIIKNAKQYNNIKTKRVGNFSAVYIMVCDKKVFKDYVLVDFEGKKYKAPIGYDEWLRAFYGDYMRLPPKEKQVSHHSFVAYFKD